MGQGQVDGQQLHAQQKEMMVIPEEQTKAALEEGIKGARKEICDCQHALMMVVENIEYKDNNKQSGFQIIYFKVSHFPPVFQPVLWPSAELNSKNEENDNPEVGL